MHFPALPNVRIDVLCRVLVPIEQRVTLVTRLREFRVAPLASKDALHVIPQELMKRLGLGWKQFISHSHHAHSGHWCRNYGATESLLLDALSFQHLNRLEFPQGVRRNQRTLR